MHPIDIDEAKEIKEDIAIYVAKAKKYLEQIEYFEEARLNKETELKQLREYETSITAAIDREAVQTSNTSDKVLDLVLKIETKIEEVLESIDTLIDEKNERIRVIELVGLDNALCYKLLYKCYVEFKDLTVVASELPKSYPYVLELHREALKKVAKILKNLQNPI